jgi:hypothetical protein
LNFPTGSTLNIPIAYFLLANFDIFSPIEIETNPKMKYISKIKTKKIVIAYISSFGGRAYIEYAIMPQRENKNK